MNRVAYLRNHQNPKRLSIILKTNKKSKIKKNVILIQKLWRGVSIRKQHIINQYFEKITPIILNLLLRKRKKFIYEQTIFGIENQKYKLDLEKAHTVRQIQMKEGEIAQICMSLFHDWQNLNVGHSSGLDLRKKDNSYAIELKNKYNTCNSSSEKVVLDKLANYKKKHPNCVCVYGIVNPKPNCKQLIKKIIHNNQELYKIQGRKLFRLVFTYKKIDYSEIVIQHVKKIINLSIVQTIC